MSISKSTISLFITISFSIPFIIIAFEFFPDEQNCLMQLRDAVSSSNSDLQTNWTGIPCNLENESRWAGIVCSDWHVTRLVLEGVQLTGSLPSMFLHNLTLLTKLSFGNNSLHGPLPDLTNLTNLETILMSRNHFSGPIPSGYVNLPKLTELELQENELSGQIPPFNQLSLISFNVSNNQLEGLVPQTHVLQRFPNSSYAGNPTLCVGNSGLLNPCLITVLPPAPAISPPPSPVPLRDNGGGLKLWSVAIIAAAAIVSLIFLSCYYFYRRSVYGEENRGTRSHWSESTDDDQERSIELEFMDSNNSNNNKKNKPIFDLDDLLCAAAEEIGRGKLGPTYKAILECGSTVAVKRLEETNTSKNEFARQVRLLGNIKHESLAKVISFHHSKEEKMIVYEYVPDPSLFSLLHGENRVNISTRLNWKTRISIIEEIAKAMDFLHNQRVPHGNLKSSNVLIRRVGVNIRVKLTDYGFLRIVPGRKLSVGKTPEFRDSKRKLTRKADVYCFGILVLELVTGKVPLSPNLLLSSPLDNNDLSGWVKEAVNNEWSTDILDAEILGENEGYDDMLRLMEIALECTDELPERRPNMSRVLRNLRDMHATLS